MPGRSQRVKGGFNNPWFIGAANEQTARILSALMAEERVGRRKVRNVTWDEYRRRRRGGRPKKVHLPTFSFTDTPVED